MRLLIVASVLSIAYAQVQDKLLTTFKLWKGPIADHKLGIHPPDTPEVAAAKAQHLMAYYHALSLLTELDSKEDDLLKPAIAMQKPIRQKVQIVQNVQLPLPIQTHPTNFKPTQVLIPTKPTGLAENIPRSALGEVPEVAAAREAHLKAYEQARRLLPKIPLE